MTNEIVCFLERTATGDTGTFGGFTVNEMFFHCVTLELPNRHNTPMLSRIPAGRYLAEWSYSKRFKREMYRLLDVPGRAGILIHAANFAGDKTTEWQSDLSGCIALGLNIDTLTNYAGKQQPAITDSRSTIARFEKLTEKRPLIIFITDEPTRPEYLGA